MRKKSGSKNNRKKLGSKNNRKTSKESDRITEYISTDASPEYIPKTEIAKQPEFYKIPRRFGAVPVDELPLLCDKDEQYYKIYPRISLPFQKAGKISFGHVGLEPNRLFWGDNLHVMRNLPSNYIDLIYIDPPFFSGRNYNMIFGDQNEIRSFTDIWEGGMPGYLIWLNARLLEMKRLLKPTGSIYVHLDWHAVHYVKSEMDKIFGYDNFVNEIVWKRSGAHNMPTKGYVRNTDSILFYKKGSTYVFNEQRTKYGKAQLSRYKKDKNGRLYKAENLTFSTKTPGRQFEWRGTKPPPNRSWGADLEELEKLWAAGRILTKKDGTPRMDGWKIYLDETKGSPVTTLWDDIERIGNTSGERIGYPTQKPESLLERIITASTNEGDVIADFFCGGGTTPTVAQKLNRRWIACDQSRVAVAITQGRLESMYEEGKVTQARLTPVPDISLEYWGTYEIPTLVELSDEEFRNFVISAYGGRVASAGTYIHGFKRDIPLFVGPAVQEKQVTKDDVVNFAKEIATKRGKNQGTMLAWAFSPSAKNAAEKLMAEGNPEVELIQISPIEIESPQFREHVTKLHDEYESFLRFILPPEVRFSFKRIKPLTYLFDVSESVALNSGAKIINVQWDFDFKGRFTPTRGFAFGRDSNGNPLYKVEYKFEDLGKRTMACRVQDDLGGEKIYPEMISVQ